MNESELLDILTGGEQEVRAAFQEVIAYLRETNSLEALESAVQAGETDRALAMLDEAGGHIAARIEAVYTQSALAEARAVTAEGAGALVRYSISNPSAVERLQVSSLGKIQGFTEEQRTLTRQIIERGVGRGENPRTIARELRGSIGLTPAQDQIIDNYRRQLENGQWREAQRRQLHDDRYNRAFTGAERRAQGGTALLSEAQVDRMVESYRASFVKLRTETIARTEALRAVHEGQEELYRQSIEAGLLDAEQLEQTWHAGAPPRTRAWHYVMNGQTMPWGQRFTSGQGNRLRYPGDDNAPGSEVCNCRCARTVRITRHGNVRY